MRTVPKLMRQIAVQAVQEGASVADTARRYGISRSTLHRWLRAFDPHRPVASLRPGKRGPKTPRWGDEAIDLIVELIGDHLALSDDFLSARRIPGNQWGRHRVAVALAERGIIVSEATVARMLIVARERLAQKHAQEVRAEAVRQRRDIRTAARRAARDTERREIWRERLAAALEPGLDGAEGLRRFADAFASKGWKIQAKDLTPELESLADWYLTASDAYLTNAEQNGQPISEKDRWLREAHRHVADLTGEDPEAARLRAISRVNISHLRAGALNEWVKNYKSDRGSAPPGPLLLAGAGSGAIARPFPQLPRLLAPCRMMASKS